MDAALPFGLRSAPVIFNAVAETLAFVIRQRGVDGLDHYLDDLTLVEKPRSQQCKRNLEVALALGKLREVWGKEDHLVDNILLWAVCCAFMASSDLVR